jgi:hypothetical protein
MNKLVSKVKTDNENGARKSVIEDLFYDLNRSRAQVYRINFVRGLFFGFGSVIGGTLVVGIIVWLLSRFVDLPGGIGNFIQYVVDVVTHR